MYCPLKSFTKIVHNNLIKCDLIDATLFDTRNSKTEAMDIRNDVTSIINRLAVYSLQATNFVMQYFLRKWKLLVIRSKQKEKKNVLKMKNETTLANKLLLDIIGE